MITIFRRIRLWQLRTKWKLAFWQFIDKQAAALLKNPEELEKMFVHELAELMHYANQSNSTEPET